MTALLFCQDTSHPLFDPLLNTLKLEPGRLEQRRFPDGETYLRVDSDVRDRPVVVLADLANPDGKFLPLCFLCDTLTELGATSIGLVVPYLCYMRQDKRFQSGEAVTSRIFAKLLSERANWLVTVDPHLHRYHDLNEIYNLSAQVIHAGPEIARWLQGKSSDLVLVGPDAESEQWVAEIAQLSGHDFIVGEKQRHGDRDVTVQLPHFDNHQYQTAVIIDDVISSGQTVLQCMAALKSNGVNEIDCIVTHALFSDKIEQELRAKGLHHMITTNTIPHPSNAIDLSGVIAACIAQQLET